MNYFFLDKTKKSSQIDNPKVIDSPINETYSSILQSDTKSIDSDEVINPKTEISTTVIPSSVASSTVSNNQLPPALNSIPNSLDCISMPIKETHIFTPKMETIPVSQEIIMNNNNSNKNKNLDDEFVKEYHDVEYKIESFRTTPPPLPPLSTTDVNTIFDDDNDVDDFDDFNDYKTGPIQNSVNDVIDSSRIYDINLADDMITIPESSVLDNIETVFNNVKNLNDDLPNSVVNGIIDGISLNDLKMDDEKPNHDEFCDFQMNEIVKPIPPPIVPNINSISSNSNEKNQQDPDVTTKTQNFINYNKMNSFFDINTITPITAVTIPIQPLQPTTVMLATTVPQAAVVEDDDEWSDFISSDTVPTPSITNSTNVIINSSIINNNKITTDTDDWTDFI